MTSSTHAANTRQRLIRPVRRHRTGPGEMSMPPQRAQGDTAKTTATTVSHRRSILHVRDWRPRADKFGAIRSRRESTMGQSADIDLRFRIDRHRRQAPQFHGLGAEHAGQIRAEVPHFPEAAAEPDLRMNRAVLQQDGQQHDECQGPGADESRPARERRVSGKPENPQARRAEWRRTGYSRATAPAGPASSQNATSHRRRDVATYR